MGRRVVVFAGPTIGPAEVHAVLPAAEVRPPAGRGDLLAVDWRRGDTAVLVDGYFRERRSIGHKELLWLLNEGVDVIGAASMGALRAAEVAPYGVRGIGEVYRMYASGEIDGDDEVGVLHGPADRGYPPMTAALVNVRYGCRRAVAAGLMTEDAADRIVATVKELPFVCRGWPEITARSAPSDVPALELLADRIAAGEWDLKRLDATAALLAVHDPSAGRVEDVVAVDDAALTGVTHGWQLRRGSGEEYAPGRFLSDLDVLNAARLFDPDYPTAHERVLSGLLADLAAARGLSVSGLGLAELGVHDTTTGLPGSLSRWLTDAELTGAAQAEWSRLIMVRVWPVWQSVDWRPTVIAELRADPGWASWCEVVAAADECAERTRYTLKVPPAAVCGQLFPRHWRRAGSSPDVELARRGFTGADQLGAVVRRFFAYDVQRTRTAAGR